MDFANQYSPLLYVMGVLKIGLRFLVFFGTLLMQVSDFFMFCLHLIFGSEGLDVLP